jgi:hypothetical protein
MSDLSPPPGRKLGYVPRDPKTQPFGSLPCSAPWSMELIPRDEWKDRIDAINASGTDLLTLSKKAGMTAKDQDGRGYCWFYGGTRALEVVRVIAGLKHVSLSAWGGAYTKKNGRDEGGNTWDVIPFLAEKGCPTEEDWPNQQNRPVADKDTVWQNAKQFRLPEWDEMEENNLDQKMTALLNGLPVCAGYAHWGHMVCDMVPMYRMSGSKIEYGVRGWNSWGTSWGPHKDGTYELWGKKAISFDQVTARASTITAG